ncbi:hypothetical protein JMG10_02615 [Nostoc ellipsosporum NOK]|nr:hypothetical protein [Nostoc ellipsosporum NOK]
MMPQRPVVGRIQDVASDGYTNMRTSPGAGDLIGIEAGTIVEILQAGDKFTKIKKVISIMIMLKKNNKLIALAILYGIFISCNDRGNFKPTQLPSKMDDSDLVLPPRDKVIDAFDASLDSEYKQIMDTEISDERLFDIIQDSFFSVASPDNIACFFYFKFIQSNRNAALSEAISIKSYEMWKNDTTKSKNLLALANNLPAANRKMILSSIVQAMCLDLNANNYNLQLFEKDFPPLNDTVAVESAKKCFDDWIE